MATYRIRDINLAPSGEKKIQWAAQSMATLMHIRQIFSRDKPLKGIKISACLHITKETANLIITLIEGGAEVYLAASNPLSTQDDVAAALVKNYGVEVYGIRGDSPYEYYENIRRVIERSPNIVIDDGGDLISIMHEEFPSYAEQVWGGSEETTTGVIREKALEREGKLKFPVIATNNAHIKRIVDNKFGTGQSTIDGILRATSHLIAGKTVVVAGYGYVGRGIAHRLKGLGAKVIVTEVDPLKALEAHYDGFWVMSMDKAAEIGDIFITATGNRDVITYRHVMRMKRGAILANSGHFDVEIAVSELKSKAKKIETIRQCVEKFVFENGHYVYLLGGGRLVNLVCAEGHPSEVMNISFSLQALVVKYLAENYEKLEERVYEVPHELELAVAGYTLEALGLTIDKLTENQERYLRSWKLV